MGWWEAGSSTQIKFYKSWGRRGKDSAAWVGQRASVGRERRPWALGKGIYWPRTLESSACSCSGHCGCPGGSRVHTGSCVQMEWRRKGQAWSVRLTLGRACFDSCAAQLALGDSHYHLLCPVPSISTLPCTAGSGWLTSASHSRRREAVTSSPSPGRGGLEIPGPSAETHLSLDHDVSSSPGPTPHRPNIPSDDSCQLPNFYSHLF